MPKQTEPKTIDRHIRIPTELERAIRKQAEKEKRNFSNMCNLILEIGLKQRK